MDRAFEICERYSGAWHIGPRCNFVADLEGKYSKKYVLFQIFADVIYILVLGAILLFSLTAPVLGAQTPESVHSAYHSGGRTPSGPVAMVSGVHLVTQGAGKEAVLLVDLPYKVPISIEALSMPHRLTLDLDRVTFAPGVALSGQRKVGPVTGYRAGLFLQGQSRIVLELDAAALVVRTDFVAQSHGVRLVVQITPVAPARFAKAVEEARSRRVLRAEAAIRPPSVAPPKAGTRAVVVIDPGHGGLDSGAIGGKGEQEKDIVLAHARALQQRLLADGTVDVMLTREEDRFIPLGERVRFAREKGARLFISLHADSLPGEDSTRGASIYTRSERASDAAAARAAEKENLADMAAGLDPEDTAREGVESILVDLARRETRLFSLIAARDVSGAFAKAGRLHKTPLRSAGFRVLQAPDMPAILVELGYLSNVDDTARLLDPKAREAVAADMAEAIVKFIRTPRDAIAARLSDLPQGE